MQNYNFESKRVREKKLLVSNKIMFLTICQLINITKSVYKARGYIVCTNI